MCEKNISTCNRHVRDRTAYKLSISQYNVCTEDWCALELLMDTMPFPFDYMPTVPRIAGLLLVPISLKYEPLCLSASVNEAHDWGRIAQPAAGRRLGWCPGDVRVACLHHNTNVQDVNDWGNAWGLETEIQITLFEFACNIVTPRTRIQTWCTK